MIQLHIMNIYAEEPVRNVELTLYNTSAYFASGEQDFNDSGKYRLCDTYTADLSGNVMATMHMLYELPEDSEVARMAKEASIADNAVIKADITYKDGTTKTEYLGLGSYEGRHCNVLDIYRLKIEE